MADQKASDGAVEGWRTEDGGSDPEVAVLCVRLVAGRGGLEGEDGWMIGGA
jgi:hypothetical protein